MNDLFYRLKNLPIYLCPAFAFCAALLILINTISLFGFDELYSGVSAAAPVLFSCASALLMCHYSCKSFKKALAAGFCILAYDAVLFSLCSAHISFVFGIILSLFFSYIAKRFPIYQCFLICIFTVLVLSLSAGLSYEYLYSVLKKLCGILKGRGALFGAVNNLYSLLFSNNLSSLFFHKDYSGTAFSGGRIVSGVLDIFEAQGVAGTNASRYLSGKFIVNIFVCSALFLLINKRLDKNEKTALFICFLLAVLFGDIRLFSLFLLIYNPLMYLGFLLITAISYFSAYLLDVQLVYFKEGGIFELIKYRDKVLYFILAGFVIAVLTYFFEKIILSKYDFQSRKILPYDVKKIVSALGGDENIERINGERVELKNPNLIDILRLDCDIRGNNAYLNYDDLILLNKYYL